MFGTTHRRRSPGNVADEVASIVDRYRPDRLWYADDVFAIHRTWTVEYAKELEQRKIHLPFECISRAERIDDEVAAALASLGEEWASVLKLTTYLTSFDDFPAFASRVAAHAALDGKPIA